MGNILALCMRSTDHPDFFQTVTALVWAFRNDALSTSPHYISSLCECQSRVSPSYKGLRVVEGMNAYLFARFDRPVL